MGKQIVVEKDPNKFRIVPCLNELLEKK